MKETSYKLDDVYLDLDKPLNTSKINSKFISVDEVMKKSVIVPGFEQLEVVPKFYESERRLKANRKKEKAKTKGSEWYNLPATPLTPEVENDLKVIQMRSALGPKHFYKKNDLKTALPKYFQVGKVLDSPVDFYHNRVPKKQRKNTIVEELLADAEFQKSSRKRFKEIIEQRKKSSYKAQKHARRLKRKGKSK